VPPLAIARSKLPTVFTVMPVIGMPAKWTSRRLSPREVPAKAYAHLARRTTDHS
jgi:hypothetical protein